VDICVSCPLSAICMSGYPMLFFFEMLDVPVGDGTQFSPIRRGAWARLCRNEESDDDILLDVPLLCPGRKGSNHEGKPHM
jgi:hypothetical protein